MMNLPKSTEFNRRIPKQKFYENLSVTPDLKRCFVDEIKTIYWKNKIATTTLNVGEGERVNEIEVFEITLNQPSIDLRILKIIDKEIPYHIIFILKYGEEYQAWIGYKEQNLVKSDSFKVNTYYHTEWVNIDIIGLNIDGLSMDEIYDNFIRQIAGERLSSENEKIQETQTNIKDAVERDNKRVKLKKQISTLSLKIKSEKQFNKQVAMNTELKNLYKELEELR